MRLGNIKVEYGTDGRELKGDTFKCGIQSGFLNRL